MTPKGKADSLIDKYCELLKFDYPIESSMKLCATRCAIICVEQIIEEMKDSEGVTGSSFVKWERIHWEAVLEILNT